MTHRQCWNRIWAELGVSSSPNDVFDALLTRYSEPHRAYHTLRHIDECFAHFEKVRSECSHAAEVELAIWFHDAIYDPRSSQNEDLSAEWAERVLRSAGASEVVAKRIRDLVLVTRHNATPGSADGQVLIDIDLSILGAPAERFDEYEAQVRREYEWVPEPAFRAARAKILEEFVARPSIYSTEWCHQHLEEQAQRNLRRSLAQLAGARPQRA